MAIDYTKTRLFFSTLSEQHDDYDEERKILRESYMSARRNLIGILDQIHADFPNLTLHNIDHIDGLWDVADVIIGETFPMSPLESFVLGCAFLIHDAALSYDIIGGREKLRENPIWKDYIYELKQSNKLSQEECEKAADFSAIRTIHAQEAANLMLRNLSTDSTKTFYLLENQELREHYGELIGDIAASHHWNIEKVSQLPTQINTNPMFPRSWRINPMKIACILRCADAGHVDMGRAPDYLYHILHINGISAEHWRAQNHLAKIDIDQQNNKRILITSTHAFKENEFAAWNVAFCAIRVLDQEVKNVNTILHEKCGGLELPVKEVAGAKSKEELAKYIKTEGWSPCEANLYIDDVCGIVEKLGGEALYGKRDQIVVAFRELIQNARDAIQARYVVDPAMKGQGKIFISIDVQDSDTFVTISDNGIGMSENVLKTCFLNFGQSFWHSQAIKMEYPGLLSSSLRPVGKYGIGFYSIFMVASSAEVMTRVYSNSLDSAIKLKFPNGLTLTPIKCSGDNTDTTICTSIKFKINNEKFNWTGNYIVSRNSRNSKFEVPFSAMLKRVVAGLDVDVYYKENNQSYSRIHMDITNPQLEMEQWLRDISYADYKHDSSLDNYIKQNYNRLEKIYYQNKMVGLAALNTDYSMRDQGLFVFTIGGLTEGISPSREQQAIGYVDGEPSSAVRHGGKSFFENNPAITQQWAVNQFERLKPTMSSTMQYYLQYVLFSFHVDPIDIVCVSVKSLSNFNMPIKSLDELISEMRNGKHLLIALSNILSPSSENELIVDNYVEDAKIYSILQDNDLYLETYMGGGFYNYGYRKSVYDENDISFYGCLQRRTKMLGYELKTDIRQNVMRSLLGPVNLLVFSI